jgi:hypothetical protein
MGSLGRLVGTSLGKVVFFKNHALKKTALEPPRGCPIWGGGVYRAGGIGASAPIFVILSIHALATSNSENLLRRYRICG